MPDEISHILWTYLLIQHPRVKAMRDLQSARGVISTYVFGVLPDVGNLIMMLLLVNYMAYNNIAPVVGPAALNNPEVRDFFYNSVKPVYYTFHSYITLAVIILLAYLASGRVYTPALLGMGSHLTLDILTHADETSLKPFYPISDLTVNGLLHWGGWTFYLIEITAMLAYTLWLHKNKKK